MGIVYFFAAVILLLLGYLTYAVVVEKIFGIDPERLTPVQTKADGVDYVPLKGYKIFFIQLLNIAGLARSMGLQPYFGLSLVQSLPELYMIFWLEP